MVQATDFADWHNVSQLRRLDRPPVRRILGEGEVGPSAVVVLEVPSEDVSQVALAEDEDMVKTLSPDRADEAFREGILPGASGSREGLLESACPHTLAEEVPVDRIAIAKEIGRGAVVGEGVHDLLGCPSGRWMLGEVLDGELAVAAEEAEGGGAEAGGAGE